MYVHTNIPIAHATTHAGTHASTHIHTHTHTNTRKNKYTHTHKALCFVCSSESITSAARMTHHCHRCSSNCHHHHCRRSLSNSSPPPLPPVLDQLPPPLPPGFGQLPIFTTAQSCSTLGRQFREVASDSRRDTPPPGESLNGATTGSGSPSAAVMACGRRRRRRRRPFLSPLPPPTRWLPPHVVFNLDRP